MSETKRFGRCPVAIEDNGRPEGRLVCLDGYVMGYICGIEPAHDMTPSSSAERGGNSMTNYKPDSIPGEVRLSSDNPIEISGRDGRGMHRAVLRHVADVGTVDLRKISEPFRQRLIDLAMMEPPLVDVDADRVTLTDAGRAELNRTYLESPER